MTKLFLAFAFTWQVFAIAVLTCISQTPSVYGAV
jgi:hypothetical protein